MFNRKKPSSDLTFLSAYHAARLAEFEYVHNSGVSIDTKSSVMIAGNFALIALIYAQESLSCLINIALALGLINILIGVLAISVKNHKGPVANVSFKDDTKRGDEARVMLQLIEDTEHFTNENLKIVRNKKRAWIIQVILLAIVTVSVCVDKVI